MANSIRDYVSDDGEITYRQLTDRFGSPKEIVVSYVEEMEAAEIVNALQVRDKIISITYIACAICLALWVGAILLALKDLDNTDHGYFVVEVIDHGVIDQDTGG